jgi:hypothetical protein
MRTEKAKGGSPIIFLDFEGVISVDGAFSAGPMNRLSRIVEVLEAKVVISSSFGQSVVSGRQSSSDFEEALADRGLDLAGKIEGFIPHKQARAIEIWDWVSEHGYPRWVAVDDMLLNLPEDHFVHVKGNRGLTPEYAKQVMEKLKIGE